MDVGAAQLLRAHLLAGCRLHQRRPPKEDRALIADDDALVRHRRHIGAAGGAGAHHDRDLGNACSRHAGLIVEDAAEVALVGEDFILQRQERAAGIDHVDAGQMILARDLLRAQMLLHRHRIVGTALDGGIVGDDNAFAAADAADAGDQARGMNVAAVHAVRGQRRQFEKRRPRIKQQIDALARKQFSARHMPRSRLFAAALHRGVELGAQVRNQAFHRLGVVAEFARFGVERGLDVGHAARQNVWPAPQPSGMASRSLMLPDRISASCRTIGGRSTCAGSRLCPRRSRRAWRHADTVRWDSH